MSIGDIDLQAAIVAAWTTTLDAIFTAYWPVASRTKYLVLSDSEAQANTPFPYCCFSLTSSGVAERMSGRAYNNNLRGKSKNNLRDSTLSFNIHASDTATATAKTIAAVLAEEVIKIYGGHPTVAPTVLTPTTVNVVTMQFEREYGIRTGDEEHQWVIEYKIKTDHEERTR